MSLRGGKHSGGARTCCCHGDALFKEELKGIISSEIYRLWRDAKGLRKLSHTLGRLERQKIQCMYSSPRKKTKENNRLSCRDSLPAEDSLGKSVPGIRYVMQMSGKYRKPLYICLAGVILS